MQTAAARRRETPPGLLHFGRDIEGRLRGRRLSFFGSNELREDMPSPPQDRPYPSLSRSDLPKRCPCRYALGLRPVTHSDQALGGLPVLSIRTPYHVREYQGFPRDTPLSPPPLPAFSLFGGRSISTLSERGRLEGVTQPSWPYRAITPYYNDLNLGSRDEGTRARNVP